MRLHRTYLHGQTIRVWIRRFLSGILYLLLVLTGRHTQEVEPWFLVSKQIYKLMKMKRLSMVIALVCGAFILGACNKFLDIKPEDFLTPPQYYENEKQLNNALNAVYSILGHYTTYGREMPRMGLDGDDGFYNVVNTLTGVQIYDVAATDTKVGDFWKTLYSGIHRANLLLANLDRSEAIPVETKDQVKGEALFLRSYFYFLLVSNFGGVP